MGRLRNYCARWVLPWAYNLTLAVPFLTAVMMRLGWNYDSAMRVADPLGSTCSWPLAGEQPTFRCHFIDAVRCKMIGAGSRLEVGTPISAE